MSFKNMFRENYEIMKEALQTNDVAAASSLIGKKISSADLLLQYHMDFSKLSDEMTRLLVHDVSDAHWQKWGFKAGSRDALRSVMFFGALSKGRTDLMEIFISADIKLPTDKASYHPFTALCDAKMPEEIKQAVLGHILKQGIDKVEGGDQFLKTAAAAGFIAGFDAVKPRLTVDIHSDNEHMLRHAASAGQTEMCLHLAQKHAADIDVALITERTLGHQKAAETLETARAIFKPDARPAPSIAGLAAQVQTLEQTVAELQANMRDITARLETLVPDKRLDKRLAPQTLSRG
ncbi:MAG: hypothetical protein Q8K65_06475 [Alphaproteobacteria bacterium]|nr:hypothetical protein [Alphaproteobacteria bacterium]